MDKANFRQMKPEDGEKIAQLCKASPDTGSFSYYPDFKINPYDGLSSQYPNHVGVVAEIDSYDGLIGVGDSIFGECFFNGEIRKFAFLKAYHVHSGFRRYKVGTGIDQFLVKNAHEKMGNNVLMLGSVQTKNVPQLSMILKSSGWVPHTRFYSGVFDFCSKPPLVNAKFEVNKACKNDLETISSRLNEFYKNYNLYEPQTPESLDSWISNPLFSEPFCHYYVVMDKNKNILAGIGIIEEYRVRTFVVCDIPFTTKIINIALKIIPKNKIIRQLIASKIWFDNNHRDAADYLFKTIRWEWRQKADVLICHYDPRSPLAEVLQLPKWRPKVEYFVMTLEQMNDQLIYPII
ncbi:MAG: hypothetical protein HQK78_04160 [Desulfobacterales bacterium]|nr:hypothetical protein [Desulfobacterales bacterium]